MREGSRNGDGETSRRCSARHAVIGPTTACALEELGMLVDVVAAKPNPEALADGIAKFDESHV